MVQQTTRLNLTRTSSVGGIALGRCPRLRLLCSLMGLWRRRALTVSCVLGLVAGILSPAAQAQETPSTTGTQYPYAEVPGAPRHPGSPFPAPAPSDTAPALSPATGEPPAPPTPAPPPAEPTTIGSIPLPPLPFVGLPDIDPRSGLIYLNQGEETVVVDHSGNLVTTIPHAALDEPNYTDDVVLFLEELETTTVIHRYDAATATLLTSHEVPARLESAVEAGDDVWFLSRLGVLGSLDVTTGDVTLDVGVNPFSGDVISSDLAGHLVFTVSGDLVFRSIEPPFEVVTVLEDLQTIAVTSGGSAVWTGGLSGLQIRDPSALDQVLTEVTPYGSARLLRYAPEADIVYLHAFGNETHFYDAQTTVYMGSAEESHRAAFSNTGEILRAAGTAGAHRLDRQRLTHEISAISQPVYRPEIAPTVRLMGTAFGAATEVTVNGVPTAFSVESHDTLSFVGPEIESPAAEFVVSTRVGRSLPASIPVANPAGTKLLSVTTFPNGTVPTDYSFDYQVDCVRPGLPDVRALVEELAPEETQILVVPTWALCDVAQVRDPVSEVLPFFSVSSGLWDRSTRDFDADTGGVATTTRMRADRHFAFRSDFTRQARTWVYVAPVGGGQAGTTHRVTVTCPNGTFRADIEAGFGQRFTVPGNRRCTYEITGTSGAEVTSAGNNSEETRKSRFRSYGSEHDYIVFFLDYGGVERNLPVVVGAPGETVKGRANAGVVHVFPVDGAGEIVPGAELTVRQGRKAGDRPEQGDRFGASVVTGDFNADGYTDLAIGAPGEDIGRHRNAGRVHVLYGGPRGYKRASRQVFDQSDAGVPGTNGRGDEFGATLAVYDSNGDGIDDLAIGVPGERVGNAKRAGRVVVLAGGATGLTTAAALSLTQGDGLVPGKPERGDRFGAALAGDGPTLVAGAPYEDIGRRKNAGVVTVIDNLLERAEVISTSPSQGARAGTAVDVSDFAIAWGAPGTSDRFKTPNAGAIHAYFAPFSDNPARAADDARVQGVLTDLRGVRLGSSIEVLHSLEEGGVVIFAGAPGENRGAGAVIRARWDPGSVFTEKGVIRQGNNDVVPDTPEAGDRFGETVIVTRNGALMIGAPGESIPGASSAGAVVWLRGTQRLIHQNTRGVGTTSRNGDEFGASSAG